MSRRGFLKLAGLMGLAGLGGLAMRYWPQEGMINACPDEPLPDSLLNHDLVQAAWDGLRADQVWDGHVHLIGLGDGGSGAWVNPDMRSLLHPFQYAQFKLYMNAACIDQTDANVDQAYVEQLLRLQADFAPGSKLTLMAFDYYHDLQRQKRLDASPFHVPNRHAHEVALRYPDKFEWIASVHPYREDCVQALEHAVATGARAVKWLPSAMGIDPSSPRCDPLYETMARLDVPLLSHAGTELAVPTSSDQVLGNPLLLRRALDHGVRVIVAHCASLGENRDLDRRKYGQPVANFDLFRRLMDEQRYESLLFGEISAMLQLNRIGRALETVISRDDWQHRLLNGSDYPLPGVMPLISLQVLVDLGYLSAADAKVLAEIRRYNPLLFDFVCKRGLNKHGKHLADAVFMTRRVFEPPHNKSRPKDPKAPTA